MANPNNICVFKGSISTKPHFIVNKTGTEFACEFYLTTQRNYRNAGVFLSDSIPMRLEGEAIMTFAHTLNEGDGVDVVSSYVTRNFNANGNEVKKSYFLISDIKRTSTSTDPETGEGYVELPI